MRSYTKHRLLTKNTLCNSHTYTTPTHTHTHSHTHSHTYSSPQHNCKFSSAKKRDNISDSHLSFCSFEARSLAKTTCIPLTLCTLSHIDHVSSNTTTYMRCTNHCAKHRLCDSCSYSQSWPWHVHLWSQ